jgi:hypothetical protein
MRASDADRDHIAERLREALAEGRLTVEEHAERLDAVYRAKTYAELAPVVEDLPSAAGDGPPLAVVRRDLPAPRTASPNIVAIFSSADRRGRWLIEPQINAVSVFGVVELDLRQAVLSRREITINAVTIFGSITLTVPPGVRVDNSAVAVMGNCSLPSEEPADPNAPVIRLTGFALFGSVDVRRDGGTVELRHLGRSRESRRAARRELRYRRR